MEKSEVLKARVSEELHRQFSEACFAIGVSPAAKLRALIEAFVAEQHTLTEDDVKIAIDQPDTYMDGAYRVRMTLRKRDAMEFAGVPLTFALPRLPKRRIHPDKGFAAAASNWDGEGSGLDGVFVDGAWEGHIYSNGVSEEDNPSSIEAVLQALKSKVESRIAFFRDR